jgi:hypothetical protein
MASSSAARRWENSVFTPHLAGPVIERERPEPVYNPATMKLGGTVHCPEAPA